MGNGYPKVALVSEDIEAEYKKRIALSLLPVVATVLLALLVNWFWLGALIFTLPVTISLIVVTKERAKILRWRYKHIARLHNWAAKKAETAFAKGESSLEWSTWSEYGSQALAWYVYWDADNGEWWKDIKAFAEASPEQKGAAGWRAVNSAMYMNTYAGRRGWYKGKRPVW